MWLNISDDKARYKFTIGAICRHPDYSTIENFSEALSNSLNLLTKRKGKYYLLGDININISPDKRTPVTETYLDYLTSCGAIPVISIPTRVAGDSLTIKLWFHQCDYQILTHGINFFGDNLFLFKLTLVETKFFTEQILLDLFSENLKLSPQNSVLISEKFALVEPTNVFRINTEGAAGVVV